MLGGKVLRCVKINDSFELNNGVDILFSTIHTYSDRKVLSFWKGKTAIHDSIELSLETISELDQPMWFKLKVLAYYMIPLLSEKLNKNKIRL